MPIPSVARFSRQRRERFIKETNNNNVKSNVVGPSGDFRKNVKVINNNNNFKIIISIFSPIIFSEV